MARILVVDDDQLIRSLLTSIFEMRGLECVSAAGGEEALKRLEAGGFDLVFTTWGTIGWYPDIARWGQVVGHFLRPGLLPLQESRILMHQIYNSLYIVDRCML